MIPKKKKIEKKKKKKRKTNKKKMFYYKKMFEIFYLRIKKKYTSVLYLIISKK